MKPATPAHYWIVVLDIENFSSRPDPVQVLLRESMHRVVQEAVEEARLDWDELGVKDEGDGLILFFPSQVPPVRIAGDLVRRLTEGLIELRSLYTPVSRFRLRMALHHGLATADASGWPGNATNVACRLVDAELLRNVLTAADDAPLAVIASDEFYRTVVLPGYRSIEPSSYTSVVVDLKKAPNTPAWIHVPGYTTPPGLPLQGIDTFTLEDRMVMGGFEQQPSIGPSIGAEDARQSLIIDLRRQAERSADDDLLYALEMLEGELERPDPNPRRLNRSLERVRRSLPLVSQDPRLSTGFDGICEIPGSA